MSDQKPMRIFVSLVTPFLYGMERSTIELFETLQPEVQSHFLLTYTTYRLDLPILRAVTKAQIPFSFLSDKKDWPTPRKPRSIMEGMAILRAIILGNRDTLRASRGSEMFFITSLRTPYSAFLAILAYWLRRKPVMYHWHDTLDKPSRLLRALGPLISHYVFVSEYTRARFEANNTWAITRNSPVIPNIIRYAPSSAPSPLPPNSRAILFVGQITRYKGVDLLIEAFLQIKADYPDITLHFIGTPHDDFRKYFFDAINDPECQGRITHWGYREDVDDFLKSAYILAQPSRPSLFAEAFGRSAVEAMAAGVPAICFRSGALPENVIHGETGLVCDEEDAKCLAHHIRTLLDDPSLRHRYAQQARTRYEKYYAPEILKAHWMTFLQSLRTEK